MKARQLIVFLILSALQLNAQTILLEKDPAADTTKQTFGPNRAFFHHFYIGGGAVTGPQYNNAKLKTTGNYNLQLGWRYKLRCSNYYAIGADVNITNMVCNLKQQNSKILPNTILHTKERLNWMYLNLSLYNRFNFKKRGNIIGNYIDIGVTGSYCPSSVHFYMDKTPNGRTLRTRERGFNYFNPFAYSVFGRIGFNQLAFSVSYRLSKLFKSNYSYPNIAPINVTVEIAIY